jgi:hypothetical protein
LSYPYPPETISVSIGPRCRSRLPWLARVRPDWLVMARPAGVTTRTRYAGSAPNRFARSNVLVTQAMSSSSAPG